MIENHKDLQKLLKLCRQYGVTKITLGTCSLELGELTQANANPDVQELEDQESAFIESLDAPLTHEEAVAFAAGA